MFSGKKEADAHEKKLSTIKKIISIADVDTVYRDIYIEHARNLLHDVLPPDSYNEMVDERARLSRLPNKINTAMEKGDWSAVKELSRKMEVLHKWTESNEELFNIGQEVYDSDFIRINPFSPGLHHVAGIKINNLPDIRNDIIKDLDDIILQDSSIKDFYLRRRQYFNSIRVGIKVNEDKLNDETELKEQAKQALEHGDISRLEELSDKIMAIRKKNELSDSRSKSESEMKNSEEMKRSYEFSRESLIRAENLGLKAVRVESSKQHAFLCRYAISHAIKSDEESIWSKIEEDPLFKNGIPEQLKIYTEKFSKHLFINSLGTRYSPDFVEEDLLVEDFPEDAVDSEQGSRLLNFLGFDKRKGLSRIIIERALSMHEYRIIKDELALDPAIFKLVCIPSDVYLRLGESLGWGKQELWTHFDGYEILQNRRFSAALAGGDCRFGGTLDLVTIGREYESDHVIARFALIQRKGMMKML